ncbi:MAG: hypothetical protein SO314_05535 [Alphaproteobacteria bacterium]|nr:hypothetical protein [Alphaproteobacteria bacterium]
MGKGKGGERGEGAKNLGGEEERGGNWKNSKLRVKDRRKGAEK